jgi:succinate dehydrogenase / fumarate reductase membrane anchor subunit
MSGLGLVLGRDSAKHGVAPWRAQRLTAVALIPLCTWFVVSLLAMPMVNYATLTAWIRGTLNAAALTALSVVAAQHSYLGLRVIVEDYVHHPGARSVTLLMLSFLHILLAAAAILAVSWTTFGRLS